MPEPTDILGKAGKIVGEKIKLKVAKAGDTMTGALVLSGAPAADLQAATKKYVDDGLAAINPNSISGNLAVTGKITAASLEVQGSTTVVNTTTVEVSDNVIELNKADDGSATAATSGIEVNRGHDGATPPVYSDKAIWQWSNTLSSWEAKLGSAHTRIKADGIDVTDGDGVTLNNVSLGDYSTFEAALNAALA
mgnify:CR=1 FL=1